MKLRRLSLAPIAVFLVTGAVLAQTPLEDPLDARDAKRLDKMEKVVRELRSIVFQARDVGKPVVVQPAETDFQVQELTRRVTDLERTLTRLNAQLETATYELEQGRRVIDAAQAQNKTLAERLTVLEQRAAAPEPPPPAPVAEPVPAATAAEAFAKARELMSADDLAAAEAAWQDYLKTFPNGPKIAEARYWLGKTLAQRGDHGDAAAAYIVAIRGWPQTAWAPDAVVELSRALIALKRPTDACQMLGEMTRRYPKAPAAAKSAAAAARTQAKCA